MEWMGARGSDGYCVVVSIFMSLIFTEKHSLPNDKVSKGKTMIRGNVANLIDSSSGWVPEDQMDTVW